MIVFLITLACASLVPLIIQETLELPIPSWLPYSIDDLLVFWPSYLLQVSVGTMNILVQAGVDNLFIGFMILVMYKQEVLKYRLRNITAPRNFKFDSRKEKTDYEHRMLKQCIRDHELIYR